MINFELKDYMGELNLSQDELAYLLNVNPRTIKRWLEKPSEIPESVKQAMTAWLRLKKFGLSWRPDASILPEEEVIKHLEKFISHSIILDDILQRVKERNGPSIPWVIDLKKRCATLGPIQITFYVLANNNFTPSMYIRTDELGPDLERDKLLIEDAIACFAKAVSNAGKNWSA
jgi:transcriptional regulator with XRE-family HTH domain